MLQWKYDEWERPRGKCYDCRRPYSTFRDVVVPDSVWEAINPTFHEGAGLLCPLCILRRIYVRVGKREGQPSFGTANKL